MKHLIVVLNAMKAKSIYWVAQFAGWLAYGALLLIAIASDEDEQVNVETWISVISWIILGISITHLQRFIFLRLGWLEMKLPQLIPWLLLSSTLSALLINACLLGIDLLLNRLYGYDVSDELTPSNIILSAISMAIMVVFWNAFYFTFHFFQVSRKQEVSNLVLSASNRESELKNLRSQLNPHFLFNSLNSIRALVDIEPAKAKTSITTLSNLLRQSLLMGRENTVTVEQELAIVRNYLDLEKIRFEERLLVHWEIDDSLLNKQIPPFSVQMMAENAIKHGISELKDGGEVVVSVVRSGRGFELKIANSGVLAERVDLGVGIANIKQRLDLQFGADATYSLEEIGGQVIAKIEFIDEGV